VSKKDVLTIQIVLEVLYVVRMENVKPVATRMDVLTIQIVFLDNLYFVVILMEIIVNLVTILNNAIEMKIVHGDNVAVREGVMMIFKQLVNYKNVKYVFLVLIV
jgi:UDP-2,3-diacylglucosamine pyrophosphatase LpxH